MDFTGKRVLITGSTTGIGRGAAEMFHAAGARVAINGRTAAAVARAIKEMGTERLIAAPGTVATVAAPITVCRRNRVTGPGDPCLMNRSDRHDRNLRHNRRNLTRFGELFRSRDLDGNWVWQDGENAGSAGNAESERGRPFLVEHTGCDQVFLG